MDELIQATSGSIGQVVGTACIFPLEVARTRMQAHASKTSTTQALQETFREDGISGLVRMFQARGFQQGL